MKRTFWLASYPKSGNTWLRMLIGALAVEPGGALDINALPQQSGIASGRDAFERVTFIDSDLLTHGEIDRLRPRVYEELARGVCDEDDDDCSSLPARFVKAHDAYVSTPEGEPLLAGARGADGAILIVRDPRAVAPSLANHVGATIDEAIALMCDSGFCFCGKTDRLHPQFRQKLLDWSDHAASWLDQSDLPVHLLRYEDLSADTPAALRRVLDFAGLSFSDDTIRRAVALASFTEMRRQEQERGFREAPKRHAAQFFRRGQTDAWREELTATQAERVEREHAAMMRQLGYE